MRSAFMRVRPYLYLVLGSAISALATDALVVPNRLATGGVTGIAVILHYLVNADVALYFLLLNIPLLVLGIIYLGWRFCLRTLASIALTTLMLNLFVTVHVVLSSQLLAAVYAGVVSGLGVGIVQLGEGSVGGTDILAQVLYRRRGTGISQVYLMADFVILSVAAIWLGPQIALYTWIVTYASGRAATYIIEGLRRAASVQIVTVRRDEMVGRITRERVGRGVTCMRAVGGYTATERDLLWVVCNTNEVVRLRRMVFAVDPNAFFSVTETSEVFGGAFRRYA